ncbi:NADH-quinone oxidoreductase subunit NuoN [Elioraea tepida]|uniref:NADH-quinone oxidoreductase subunit N n=2 Tax=Elioraea tepida TaxID=2843330 RepID=A0A975YJA9_9PROT|nr:NADH-quinone oxidoreductase subunit NuoN [Elioraea tepida]QXM24640.1 NADH-quinone oxidoreductase subunit NuoN [Elioraea tepida]
MAALNWTIALPEIVLALCAMAILMIGVFLRRNAWSTSAMLSLAALLVTAVLVLAGEGGRATGFSGLFVVDAFAVFAKVLVLAAAGLSLFLALDWHRREGLARFEYPVLVLFAALGMMMMVSANDLMSLYVGLELASLSLYVTAAFARDDLRSTEAGLKYFTLGALASGLLLYGASLAYGYAGTTRFDGIAEALQAGPPSMGLIVGLSFIAAGLAFKVSAVPFHMWTPDVYEGAPTPVTALFSVAPKAAAIALFLRVMTGPFAPALAQWQQIIVLISIASMLVGAFAAIAQSNIKRLMAYSSIGHVGYALIGLAAGDEAGIRGVLVYTAIYVVMNLGAFGCIVALRRDGVARERVEDFAGLARSAPLLALAMAVFMFSMAGIPPLAGFFGKLYVFVAAVNAGLWPLAVIGVLASVVSAFYYLRIVKVMYFDASEGAVDPRPLALSLVVAATGAATALFAVLPGPLLGAAAAAARSLVGG